MTNERILIVDDERHIVRLCSRVLRLEGYDTRGVTSGYEAIARLEAEAEPQTGGFQLLVVDIKMPDIDGLKVLRRGRELDPQLVAVVITGYGTLDSAIEALHAGAQRFLLKPFEGEDLIRAVEQALTQRRREEERLRLRAQLPILEIGQALIAGDDVEFLADRLLRVVAQQLGAHEAVLLLPDEESDGWHIASAVGNGTNSQGNASAGDGPGTPAPNRLRQQAQTSLSLWQHLCPESRATHGGPATDSILANKGEMAVALHTGKQVVGLLGLGRSEGTFGRPDQDLLTIVAGQIATALENASLYRQIRDSRDYFRTVLDSLHDEALVLDGDYIITDVNATFLRNMGYEQEEVIGRPCYEVIQGCNESCNNPEKICPAAEVWRTGQPAQHLHIRHDRAGKSLYVNVSASPILNSQGEMVAVVEALHDVTAQWQLESSLATVRELGQELVLSRDDVEIAHLVVNAAARILDFDRCGLWLLNEKEAALELWASTETSLANSLSPMSLDSERSIIAAVTRSREPIYLPDTARDSRYLGIGQACRSELCVPLTVKGRILGVLNAESPRPAAFDGADRRLLSTLADQAALALENARLYQAVARAEREWAETFDAITDGISIHDAEFRIVRANRTLAAWLDTTAEQLAGQPCYRLFHQEQEPPDFCPLARSMARGRPHSIEIDEPLLGSTFQVSTYPLTDDQGQVTGGVHIMHDINERKQMERQLIQSEKLTALGRLAASLAHEINNPLQALRSGLGLLIKGSPPEEKRQQYLRVASREVERLITITERMLSFYRPSADRRQLTDVNQVLDEILTLADKKLQHSRVELSCQLAPNLPPVEAVDDQLRQVFLNLVLNSLEAMPRGGELAVASGFDRQRSAVWVSLADTGEGIPAENMARIFEPLFSSKPQGTGLGLAISYGIVERHGGHIEVQSQVGEGSTFTVFLPAHSPAAPNLKERAE